MKNTIKALIIDADTKNISALIKLLQKINADIIIAATATTVAIGEQLIYQHQPEIVFLSKEMEGEAAILMLDNNTIHKNYEIVYLFKDNNCSRDCCKHHPLDCLQIPLQEGNVRTALSSLYCAMELKSRALLAGNKPVFSAKITIHGIGHKHFVLHNDILFIKSATSYSHFHLKNGQIVTSCKNLQYYVDLFSLLPCFFRAHKQQIINLDYVVSYQEDDGGLAVMVNGDKLAVSRRSKDAFLQAMEN